MAEEFNLNERDVVLTNEFIYTPFMKELGLKCSFVFQEKFGAGEPSEAMIQTMYDAIPYDSYDRVIAVGGGACADAIPDAAGAGCDTFVTSDIRYNRFWDASDLGLNLIDAGHFYTENPVCAYLAEKIQVHFPELTVQISQNHRDCMKFF